MGMPVEHWAKQEFTIPAMSEADFALLPEHEREVIDSVNNGGVDENTVNAVPVATREAIDVVTNEIIAYAKDALNTTEEITQSKIENSLEIPEGTFTGDVEGMREQIAESIVFGLRMVVGEALTNHAKHGNKDPRKPIIGEYGYAPEHGVITFFSHDCGDGFDHEEIPDPTDEDNLDVASGRGILLMKSFSERFEFGSGGKSIYAQIRITGLEKVPHLNGDDEESGMSKFDLFVKRACA